MQVIYNLRISFTSLPSYVLTYTEKTVKNDKLTKYIA